MKCENKLRQLAISFQIYINYYISFFNLTVAFSLRVCDDYTWDSSASILELENQTRLQHAVNLAVAAQLSAH